MDPSQTPSRSSQSGATTKPVIIKFKINKSNTRRISIDDVSTLTYSSLCKTIFDLLSLPTHTKLKFTWIDDEGDLISISSDSEVMDAVSVMEKISINGYLKFGVEYDERNLQPGISPLYSETVSNQFPPLFCGLCQVIIPEGVRYMLLAEKSQYYCPTCEEKYSVSQRALAIKLYKSQHHSLVQNYVHGVTAEKTVPPESPAREKLWKFVPKRNESDSPDWRKSLASTTNSSTSKSWSEISGNSSSPSKPMCRFIRDVSFLDGEKVPPLTEFTKIWRVKNDGARAWPSGCKLAPAGGDYFQVGDDTKLPQVEAGDEIDVSVTLLSPPAVGRYVSYYRPQTSEGKSFGQRLWADIRVYQPEDDKGINQKEIEPQESVSSSSLGEDSYPWKRELAILASMGFTDEIDCISKLEKHAVKKGLLGQSRRTPEEILQLTVMELLAK